MQRTSEIPKYGATEGIPFDRKTIFQRWCLPSVNFNWLIAELDDSEGVAFGYANLNDDQMAEWGDVSIRELKEVGATLDEAWEPCKFPDALKRIKEDGGESPLSDRGIRCMVCGSRYCDKTMEAVPCSC